MPSRFVLPLGGSRQDGRTWGAARTVASAWQWDVHGVLPEVALEPDHAEMTGGSFSRVPELSARELDRVVRTEDVLFVNAEGHVGHPHVLGESLLEQLLRTARVPVWAFVGEPSVPSTLTLAFHGQRKAYHAAAVTATLAVALELPVDVVVVTEADEDEIDEGDVRLAQEELLVRHVRTRDVYLESGGDTPRLLASRTRPDSLLVMGSYGDGSFLGFKLGHTVDTVLSGARGPVLLCP